MSSPQLESKDGKLQSLSIKDHYVVGIGASAGGLEAIHELFDNIPSNTGFSYIVVQHLSPDYKSLLTELLSKHTGMKVLEATDGICVEPDHVYVIPIKKLITIRDGRLHLAQKFPKQEPNKAIDIFLESLAEDQKHKAIGIILSGTGTDGTKGIEAIKNNGGLVVVQDPGTAKFDGMPNSAISSGFVDTIINPELMFQEIETYIKHPRLAKAINGSVSQEDERLLQDIFDLIKSHAAIDFSLYKRPTIVRRITRRMVFNKIGTLTHYVDFLYANPKEILLLAKEFLIGVTRFFRDHEAFDILANKVIPDIVKNKSIRNEPIKVWLVGCCTGEEAYSVAILFHEYLQKVNLKMDIKIFASDIDKDALDYASKGSYSDGIMKDVSESRLDNFFSRENGKYQVSQYIRKSVIFAHHDIAKDPPFSKVDLVCCRNLLIYLNPLLQKKVMSSLHFSLNLGGYLFLGPSENIGDLQKSFVDVDKRWNIFQNHEQARHSLCSSLGTPNVGIGNYRPYYAPNNGNGSNNYNQVLSEAASQVLGFAGIFVDENYNIIEAMGEYTKYINLPEKHFNLNIQKLVPHEVSVVLGSALLKAFKTNENGELKGIRTTENNNVRILDIHLVPQLSLEKLRKKCVLLLMKERSIEPKKDEVYVGNYDGDALIRVAELENELMETRQHLQTAIEEVETSNEELQSSNEELISSNEELQSTNEELQSLNEELHTVNAEHQLKIKELAELNDDLKNYFSSTEIGQIFLDKRLIIQKFTPAVSAIVNIIESDIGRPISHISNNIKFLDFIEDIREVIHTGSRKEKEIEITNEEYYSMRITPYVREGKLNDGVIITFVNISKLKKLSKLISGVVNSSLSGIMAFRSIRDEEGCIEDFEWILVNKAAEKIVGKDDLIGKALLREMPGNKREGLFSKYVNVVETGEPLHHEHYYNHEGIKSWFETIAVKMDDGIAVTFADISEKKQAEEKLRDAYDELKRKEESLLSLNSQLEARVGERTEALSKAVSELEVQRQRLSMINVELTEKNEQLLKINNDLDNFIYTASHDLKAPISNIEGLIINLEEILLEENFKNQEGPLIIDMVHLSINRFKETIRDLTEITKLQRDSQEDVSLIDCHAIIQDVLFMLKKSIEDSKAIINCELNDCPDIKFSKKNFKSIIYNLVSNAIKYGDPSRSPEVVIKIKRIDGYALIVVEDNGLGIEEEKKGQMFKMFKRFHDHVEGTGVGLYIVKRIIDNAGGRIVVNSQVGLGTTFNLYFKVE